MTLVENTDRAKTALAEALAELNQSLANERYGSAMTRDRKEFLEAEVQRLLNTINRLHHSINFIKDDNESLKNEIVRMNDKVERYRRGNMYWKSEAAQVLKENRDLKKQLERNENNEI